MPTRTARLAAALTAKFELAQTIGVLNRAGILPMPLKGVLLQHVVYADPADRMLSDADVLVPTARFDEAVAALDGAGWIRQTPIGRAGVALRSPTGHVEVDLHGRLFSPGLFGLTAEHLFERGRIDERTFGGVVVVPSPLDLYAHLVGNFAKGRHGAADEKLLRDFAAIASRFALRPGAIAAHLDAHGLARAARYALGHPPVDAHRRAVLDALPLDRVGGVVATVARTLVERTAAEGARVDLLAPHLVNRTLPRGAASVAVHLAIGLRQRVAKRFG